MIFWQSCSRRGQRTINRYLAAIKYLIKVGRNLKPGILVRVSTPAKPPKLRGKSPGWKTGQPRQRRIRYPIVKKRTSSSRKAAKKTA